MPKSARDMIADWLLDGHVEWDERKSCNDQADSIISALESAGYVIVERGVIDALQTILACDNESELGQLCDTSTDGDTGYIPLQTDDLRTALENARAMLASRPQEPS